MILALQALLDQRAEHHLEAHGQLVGRRHGARQGPRPIQDALRQHEENARIRVSHSAPSLYITYMFYIRYSADTTKSTPRSRRGTMAIFPSVGGRRGFKSWTWSDWTIGDLHLEYGTLTLESRGRAHFECVTYTTRRTGPDHWWAGFSLETREGVKLHRSE